jgi:CHAT domain-containing protein/Tfp pilus assembly protein PilF
MSPITTEDFVRIPAYLLRFLIGMLILVCLLFADRQPGIFSLAQSNDDDAIRNLVGRFFELYQRKDLDGLLSLWSEKSPFLVENKKSQQRELDGYEKITIRGFELRQKKIEGDKATLRVLAEMTVIRTLMAEPTEMPEKKNPIIELVKEGGNWKIWKYLPGEVELAAAIMSAKTEEERKTLMEKEPELITSDLAKFLIRSANSALSGQGDDNQHALMIYQLAYKISERLGDRLMMAYSLLNTGYLYGWKGIPEKSTELSLEYYQKSLKIGEEFGFKEIIAPSSVKIGQLYHTLGELSLAAEYYQKSLKPAEESGDHYLIAQATNNLSVIYKARGNYSKALELLLRSLKASQNKLNSGKDWVTLSNALINIGSIFSNQGNYEQALAYYQRADEAVEKGMILGDDHAKKGKADLLYAMGNVYLEKGDHALALSYYQKSLQLMENFGISIGGAKEGSISVIKAAIGDLMAAKNNTLEAINNYQDALKLAEKTGYKSEIAYSLMKLGRLYLLRGDYREALAFTERAIKIAEEDDIPDKTGQALVIAAEIHQKLGRPEDARNLLTRAIDITERLRAQYAGGELDRQRSFEVDVTPYHAMIDFQVEQDLLTEAFSNTQRAKARALLELLQNGRVNLTKSASQAEQAQEQQLSHNIVLLNRQITSEKLKSQSDEKRLAELEERLKKARLEFEAFQTSLYAAHPELKVQRGEIRPVSFDDAASLLPDSMTALLDFVVTDENVHLFVLSKDASSQPALNTYTVKIERKSLAEKVKQFRGRMANRDYDFQALSKELYALLIKPAEKQLRNKNSLVISPDNVLWDLPFQTLLSPKLRYLIEDAAISYTPSLSVLREMRLASKKKQVQPRPSLLALGNPALGNRSRELAKFVMMDAELQPLPEAEVQVQTLGRLYGRSLSQVFTGSAAREELVKKQSSSYRILHLATHGILNDFSPMYSHVMLSQAPGENDEDGLLEAWEMMNLDLNADLVVLAACETARGRVGTGEGMIGMSWALFVAGSPRTVASQWKVEASSTTALMVEFHKRFKTRYGDKQPVSTAEAMRQAALKIMRNPEYAHPFYWGGFVVIGDGN